MAVIFNGVTRQVEITDVAIVSLDVEKDIYSAWKDWSQLSDNSKYAPALRTFGGDGTITGQSAPKYFFLQNYWQVLIDNGNVVSVGLNLYTDDYDTPYVVALGSGVSDRNSDAVSINNLLIQHSSFNGVVTIDQNNTTGLAKSGTEFPAGTQLQPCINTTDLHVIASERGLNKIFVIGNLDLVLGDLFEGHEFEGSSALKTIIDIHTDAQVVNCEFYECTLTGTLDGNSQIERGVISNLNFVDGFIYRCAIGPSEIVLGTSSVANLFSCYSTVPGTSTPIIDLNGLGSLALRDYNGGMLLKNYTGVGSHSVDLASGQIKLEAATITSGTFVVRGIGKLVDSITGNNIPTGTWNGGVTIVNELLTASEIGGIDTSKLLTKGLYLATKG